MKALLFVFLLVIVRSVAEVEGSCVLHRTEADIDAEKDSEESKAWLESLQKSSDSSPQASTAVANQALNSQPATEAEIQASIKYNHGLADIDNPSEYSVHETRLGQFGSFTAIVMGANLLKRFQDEILVDKCNMTRRNHPVSVVGYGEMNYGGNMTKYWKVRDPQSHIGGYWHIRRGDDSNCLESQTWIPCDPLDIRMCVNGY